jgi:hypothetical protein
VLVVIIILAVVAVVVWKLLPRTGVFGRRLSAKSKAHLTRSRASLGPMSPRRCVRLTVREAQRRAVPMYVGSALPNVIRVGVFPREYVSWGPVAGSVASDIRSALQDLAAHDEMLSLAGDLFVEVVPDERARPHAPYFDMKLRGADQSSGSGRHAGGRPEPLTVPVRAVRKVPVAAAAEARTIHNPHGAYDAGVPTKRLCRVVVRVNAKVFAEFELVEGRHIIGRSSSAQVRIPESSVSKVHAELVIGRDEVTIRDLGSTNGTKVRWRADTAVPCGLADSDVVWLSKTVSFQVTGTGRRTHPED